jgi:hypothetical protein
MIFFGTNQGKKKLLFRKYFNKIFEWNKSILIPFFLSYSVKENE